MSMQVERHFATKAGNAPVQNIDIDVPPSKVIMLKMLDFTAPAQANAGVKLCVGPTSDPEAILISTAQQDKVVKFPPSIDAIEGPKTVRVKLDNSQNPNGAFLGVAIYYELL